MHNLRLRLATWIAPKGFVVRPWRTQDTVERLDQAKAEMTVELGKQLYKTDPADLWRETRRELVRDEHEAK